MKIDPAELAAEYHLASANKRSSKPSPRGAEVNYEDQIMALQRSAALSLPGLKRIALDLPGKPISMTLEQAITRRRSARNFSQAPVALSDLARILFLSNGVRQSDEHAEPGGLSWRNVPNAGNLGSVEIYCFAINISGIDAGIYHFDSRAHELALIKEGDFSIWLRKFACYQEEFHEAAAVLVLASALGRLERKYGTRHYRLALLDAGHVSQNIYLTATALGLSVCATAGFVDEELNSALSLDGREGAAILAHGIGHPAL